jgi:hypothetical protein
LTLLANLLTQNANQRHDYTDQTDQEGFKDVFKMDLGQKWLIYNQCLVFRPKGDIKKPPSGGFFSTPALDAD